MWRIKIISRRNRVQGSGARGQGSEKKLYPVPCTLYPEKGFTVIELLIAACLMGMVGLAVIATFGAGLRTFDRVQAFSGVQADVLLFLDQLERDVHNTFKTGGIKFQGNSQSMSFPALGSKLDEDDNEIISLAETSYHFDSSGQTIVREEKDYAQAASSLASGDVPTQQVGQITALKFQYYSYKEELQGTQKVYEYSWQDAWDDEENLPKGVSVELTFKNGEEEVSWQRTVFIPVGGDMLSGDGAQEEDDEEGEGEV